jgi:hypothetical protein
MHRFTVQVRVVLKEAPVAAPALNPEVSCTNMLRISTNYRLLPHRGIVDDEISLRSAR